MEVTKIKFFEAKAKQSQVAKIIQDFACPKLGLKRISSTKHSLEQVIKYLTFPTSLEENFVIDYSNEIYRCAKHVKNHLELSDRIAGKKRPRKLNRLLGKALEAKRYAEYHTILCSYKIHKNIIDLNHFYDCVENYYCQKAETFLPNNEKRYYWNVTGLPIYRWKIAQYRNFLKTVSETARLDVFHRFMKSAGSNVELQDTLIQWYPNRDKIALPPEYNTLKKIHDYVSKEYRKLQTKDYSICDKIDAKLIERLDGTQVEDLKIIIPKTHYELIEWGNRQHHCIASYAKSMRDGHCLLLGIERNGELLYNLEIRDHKVEQFRGKNNSIPKFADGNKIEKYLLKNGVIKPSPYKDLYISEEAYAEMAGWNV